MNEESEFRSILFRTVTSRLLQTQRRLEDVVSVPATRRLAHLLVQLGDPPGDCPLTVELPFSHEELANIVACSRQTVTEALNRWRSQGAIRYTGKVIVITHPRQFLSEAYTDN